VTGAAQGEARPSAARRFLCQHNKVVYGSHLLMMLDCLQGDFVVLAGSQTGRERSKIIKRMECQIDRILRLRRHDSRARRMIEIVPAKTVGGILLADPEVAAVLGEIERLAVRGVGNGDLEVELIQCMVATAERRVGTEIKIPVRSLMSGVVIWRPAASV
jgi:hypothetical protein